MMLRRLATSGFLAGALGLSAQPSHAVMVDLELLIGIDTSGSVDGTDFTLRREGIEAAFRDPGIIAAIEGGPVGAIAVAMWDFGNGPTEAVEWTLIEDAASANAFADAVIAAPRGGTGGGDGQVALLGDALPSLLGNDFEGERLVLDVVSEGAESVACPSIEVCVPVQDARDAFLAGGGTAINALWLNDRDFFGLDPADAVNAFVYGSTNLIGGPGAFQAFAETNEEFVPAFREKVFREITGEVPEPASLALLGLGLAGLGLRRRRAS